MQHKQSEGKIYARSAGKARCASFHSTAPEFHASGFQLSPNILPAPAPDIQPPGLRHYSFHDLECYGVMSTPIAKRLQEPIFGSDSDFKLKYKTEMCKNWEETGRCDFGETCAFAHGPSELREKVHVSEKYKTKKCRQFYTNGWCPYGARCQFIHEEEPHRLYKTAETSPQMQPAPEPAADYTKLLSLLVEQYCRPQEDVPKPIEPASGSKRLKTFELITSRSQPNLLEMLKQAAETDDDDHKDFLAFKEDDSGPAPPRTRFYSFFF